MRHMHPLIRICLLEIIAFETTKEMNMWARKATNFDDLEVTVKTNKVFTDI